MRRWLLAGGLALAAVWVVAYSVSAHAQAGHYDGNTLPNDYYPGSCTSTISIAGSSYLGAGYSIAPSGGCSNFYLYAFNLDNSGVTLDSDDFIEFRYYCPGCDTPGIFVWFGNVAGEGTLVNVFDETCDGNDWCLVRADAATNLAAYIGQPVAEAGINFINSTYGMDEMRWQFGSAAAPTYTPTPTNTSAATNTPTPSDTPTPTYTPSNTPTPSDTPTPTFTPSNTPTPSDTPTPTFTPSNTPTPSDTPTPTYTPSNTPTPSDTPSNTPTLTNTPTPSVTPTPSNTPTPTDTPTTTPTPYYDFSLTPQVQGLVGTSVGVISIGVVVAVVMMWMTKVFVAQRWFG